MGKKDPLKPWWVAHATRDGIVHWNVRGYCPLTHECRGGDGRPNGRTCPACHCEDCGEGTGVHIIAMCLTEEEASRIVKMSTLEEVNRYLLTLGDRFRLYPRTEEEALRNGVRQKVIVNPDSRDEATVFPRYVREDV